MAIYDWIYGNATLPGDVGDYRIRLCGEGLWDYTDFLTRLSIRLLSVNMRTDPDKPTSWFAGCLEDSLYLVAVGGTQNTILGPDYPLPGGYRQQFCVLGYGFSGGSEEFAQYSEQIQNRDISMFTPLRTYLWELSNGRQPPRWEGPRNRRDRVRRNPHRVLPNRQPNLFASSPERNDTLWAQWRTRPAALDILSVSDAHKMIALMPDLTATATEDIPDSFYSPPVPDTISGKDLKELIKATENGRGNTDLEKNKPFAETQGTHPQTADTEEESVVPFSSKVMRPRGSSNTAGKLRARIEWISDAVEVCKARLDPSRAEIAKEYEQELWMRMPPEKAALAALMTKWIWLALTVSMKDRRDGEVRRLLDKFIAAYTMDGNQDTLLSGCETLAEEVQKN